MPNLASDFLLWAIFTFVDRLIAIDTATVCAVNVLFFLRIWNLAQAFCAWLMQIGLVREDRALRCLYGDAIF